MKKGLLALVVASMVGFAYSGVEAHWGNGYDGYGGYGMGPGMMWGNHGYGMGPGMMWGYGNYGPGYNRHVTKNDAREIMNNYLSFIRNPNLRLGKIEEKGNDFEANILTRKGNDLVNRIFVDKRTGRVNLAY